MQNDIIRNYVRQRYVSKHGADIVPAYPVWNVAAGESGNPLAALGHRGADDGPLFLETYLREPVEDALKRHFDQPVARGSIVEIGCLAAAPTGALLRLWAETAERLADRYDYAVATLTGPLKRMFDRIGVPLAPIAIASADRVGAAAAQWGGYYALDPVVCCGRIADARPFLRDYAGERRVAA